MTYSDLFNPANYNPAAAPFYGQTGQPICPVYFDEPAMANWWVPPTGGGRVAPLTDAAVTPTVDPKKVAPIYALAGDEYLEVTSRTRSDLIRDNSPAILVIPQPKAWLFDVAQQVLAPMPDDIAALVLGG